MAICEEESGDPHQLIWEGCPPEPWGEAWQRYESEAKRMIKMVREHAATPSAAQAAPQWISVEERLPEDRQAVMFVVDCKHPSWEYLNRRVLGGTYVAGQGFGIPGLTIGASHWQPSPPAPSTVAAPMQDSSKEGDVFRKADPEELAYSFEDGLNRAREGVHELFANEEYPLDGLEGDKPFCRFEYFADGGDDSVGIPGRAYWALAQDQSGTELADLLATKTQTPKMTLPQHRNGVPCEDCDSTYGCTMNCGPSFCMPTPKPTAKIRRKDKAAAIDQAIAAHDGSVKK
jgi:hypothetical protein